jgi:hypothetical protein
MTVDVNVRRGRWLVAALCLAHAAGCDGFRGGGMSEFEKIERAQNAAQQQLEAQGAKFERFYHPEGAAWKVDLRQVPEINDETFSLIEKLDHVAALNFSGTTLDDSHLARLNDVDHYGFIIDLDLSHTGVTDAGIGQLRMMCFLSKLNVTGTKVTAAGLRQLKQNREANTYILPLYKMPRVIQ